MVSNMRKGTLLTIVVLVLILGILGILTNFYKEKANSLATGYITVEDNYGRVVQIKKAKRIVSTAPSNTEILYALGLGDKVIGVTEYCDYPENAKMKEKIGGFSTINVEKVVALQPDLVLASDGNGKETIEKMEELNLTVVVLNPKNIEDILENIKLVGKATAQDKEALELVTSIKQKIDAIKSKTNVLTDADKPRVFYVLWHDPLMSAGSQTFANDLIELAGGINIAKGTIGYPIMNLENVIDQNPQIIVVNFGHGSGANATLNYVNNEARLQETEALSTGRVYTIDANIVNRPGPRIVDALEEFAHFIHPEFF